MAAADHPNTERGFAADKVYSFSGIDSVNVFNGNLTLTLPIGGSQPVSSTLSYGVTLYYNSKVWDYQVQEATTHCGVQQDAGPVAYPAGHPTHVSDAGLGWSISFGKIFPPDKLNEIRPAGFVSADGAEHAYLEIPTSHPSMKTDLSNAPAGLTGIGYTTDNTHLRILRFSDGHREVEFPDGTVYVFDSTNEVSVIRDRFGNLVYLNRSIDGNGQKVLSIVDPHGRETKVYYRKWTGSDFARFNDYLVDRVVVPVFTKNNAASANNTATYKFMYYVGETKPADENEIVRRGSQGMQWGEVCTDNPKVPFLREIWLPDGSKYQFDYFLSGQNGPADEIPREWWGSQGTIKRMVLPTGGKIEWEYDQYQLPADTCDMMWVNYTIGVSKKFVHDGSDGSPHVWKYTSKLSPTIPHEHLSPCEPRTIPGGTMDTPIRKGAEFVANSIIDPLGRATIHYFAAWNDYNVSPTGIFQEDYSFSFLRGQKAAANSDRMLSQVVCEGGLASDGYTCNTDGKTLNCNKATDFTCGALRSIYISPDPTATSRAIRMTSEMTVFHDDGNRWMDRASSDHDGFGHDRTTVVSTNFPSLRSIVTKKDYNPGSNLGLGVNGWLYFKAGDPWITHRYTTETIQQYLGDQLDSQSKTGVCFSDTTGVLKASRTYKGLEDSPQDIVVRYTYDSAGNRKTEDWYGGDGNTAAHAALCDAPPTGSAYHLDYAYDRGLLKSTQYRGAPFKNLDQDIDRAGVAAKTSRDSAGVATDYDYDGSNRLASVEPAFRASTAYSYTNASGDTPASALVARGPDSPDGTRAKYEFDPLGRVWREYQLMPDGLWSFRENKYDAVGRRTSVTELGRSPSGPKTQFTYDRFDRVLTVTAPDQSVTYNSYTGSRETTRSSYIETPTGTAALVVKEEYDGLGRLVAVTENSGPGGAAVLTEYDYDHAGRLRRVRANAAPGHQGPTQLRVFEYDGRGFLIRESHPEWLANESDLASGDTRYTYDARGHMLKRDAPDEAFDLSFTYDAAERLTHVYHKDKPLKVFAFGTAPDRRLGKLLSATRYNYVPGANPELSQWTEVTETYDYDTAGRRSSRTTTIADKPNGPAVISPITQSVLYNDLDLEAEVTYPKCQTNCGGHGDRVVTSTYKYGRAYGVAGFINSTSYDERGLWTRRVHANNVIDEQALDPVMPRPTEFRAYNVTECPLITGGPEDLYIPRAHAASFAVSVSDPQATFQWYQDINNPTAIEGATTNTLRIPVVEATMSYWVEVKASSGCMARSRVVQAIVCDHAWISVPAFDYATAPQPWSLQDKVIAAVTAVGTELTYQWSVRKVDHNGAEVPGTNAGVGTNAPDLDWMPPSTGVWEIRVTVTAKCDGASSATRLVKVIKVEETTGTCDTPVFTRKFPSIVHMGEGHSNVYLDVAVGAATSESTFRWFVNGELRLEGKGKSAFATMVHTAVEVTVFVTSPCSDGKDSPPARLNAFVWKSVYCPTPPLTLDQTAIWQTSSKKAFTASSPWSVVKYTWYQGDSGNTRSKALGTIETATREFGSGSSFLPSKPGTYWVRAYLNCGAYADSPTLTWSNDDSCFPVQILRQPQGGKTIAGASFTLSFEPASTPPLKKIKWFRSKGNVQINREEHNERYITVQPERSSYYWASAESAYGCHTAETALAFVHVADCKYINVLQISQTQMILKGESVTLTANATSSLPDNYAVSGAPKYQWFEGELGNTTTKLGEGLQTIAVTPDVTTSYWVRITVGEPDHPDADGCAIDRALTINVCDVPVITFDPIGAVTPAGIPRWLAIEASGTNNTYQWYSGKSGDKSKPLSGATTRQLFVAPTLTTSYWVLAKNECGEDASATATVSVPPTLRNELAGGRVTKNATRVLSIVAEGEDLRYQWYKGPDETAPISGATTASYTTPPIANDVTYWVRVWSGDAWVNSNSATFIVCQPRAIVMTQPSTVSESPATLRVDVSDANESYEWYKGQSGDTTTLVSTGPTVTVTPAVTTSYWVRTRTSECTANSPTWTVPVCLAKITAQPQSATATSGGSVDLSVTATGPSPITYQWYEGAAGDTTTPMSGATGSTFKTPAATTQKSYWVAVTTPASALCTKTTINSAAAVVSVCVPPSITSHPNGRISSSGASVVLSVAAKGDGLKYRWYQGASGDTSVLLGNTTAEIPVQPQQTTDYWVRVDGTCGGLNSATARISIAPKIDTHPSGGEVTKGATRLLSVAASGTHLSYQWYANGTAIPGATQFSYTTQAINSDTTYFARVFSGEAQADSNSATFTVCQPRAVTVTQPSALSGSDVTLSVAAVSGDTYEWYQGTSGNTSTLIGTSAAVVVRPKVTTDYWLRTKRSTCTADGATVRVTICTPRITSQPAGLMVNPNETTTLSVVAEGTAALTYQWYIGDAGVTTNPISGATSASYPTPAMTATTKYWVRVSSPATGGCSSTSTDSVTATVSVCQAPRVKSHTPSQIAASGATTNLTVDAEGTELRYYWYANQKGDVGTLLSTSKVFPVNPTATTDYWGRVVGRCGYADTETIRISVAPPISQHPASASVTKNSRVTLSVAATGNWLRYEWRRSDDSVIAGETSTSYTTPPITSDTSFYVVVFSGATWSRSNEAYLKVCLPRNALAVSSGDTAESPTTLKVDATATGESYQWYRGASGDTSSPVQSGAEIVVRPTTTTSYWVRTTRATCTADSAAVTVYVCRPTITAQPSGKSINQNQTATLSVSASGDGATYQWYIGASGVTTNPITVNGNGPSYATQALSQTTTYWVQVSMPVQANCANRSVNSAAATVTVCNPAAVTVQPQPSTVSSTGTAYLSVTATGNVTRYQWYEGVKGDRNKPVGWNSNNITVIPGSTKSYWVLVIDACGTSAESEAALQSVFPDIDSQPQDVMACPNTNVTVNVAARGTGLSYQWYRRLPNSGANEPVGGDSPSLTIPAANQVVFCRITSGQATTNTREATITAAPSPGIQSISKSRTSNGIYYLTPVVYDAPENLSFAWYRGQLGDKTMLLTNSATLSTFDYGAYWVEVSYTATGCASRAATTVP